MSSKVMIGAYIPRSGKYMGESLSEYMLRSIGVVSRICS